MPHSRRLQKVGSGTLTVSLPHEWVRRLGLKPGDVVTLTETPDGGLHLSPEMKPTSQQYYCTLDLEKFRDKELLSRLIIAAYLQGFEGIKIIGGDGIPADVQSAIMATIDLLPGMEIVEQTYRRVIMQSFVDPQKFPVETLLKRIQVMITTMMNHLNETLTKERYELINEISTIENKIDGLYFLCIRQIFAKVKSGLLGEAAPEAYLHAIGDRLVVRALEEIADSIHMSAMEANVLRGYKLSKEVKEELGRLHETVQVLFGKTMKSFFSLDSWLANEVIDTTRKAFGEHFTYAEDIIGKASNPRVAAIVRSIIWNAVSVTRNCKIIAEVTVNRFVRIPSRLITIESV
ncbi:MAG: phosphate uptake regulator PhoU [Aigarchaeota archaeon]|nr:phosphate uptake regulator PhoU [Candidatus Pelearchaeum maunauluense]